MDRKILAKNKYNAKSVLHAAAKIFAILIIIIFTTIYTIEFKIIFFDTVLLRIGSIFLYYTCRYFFYIFIKHVLYPLLIRRTRFLLSITR